MDQQADLPPTPNRPKSDTQLPAYTPGFGRRLVMFLLCVVGLIIVWTFYFLNTRK